jgi:hypothetical protein
MNELRMKKCLLTAKRILIPPNKSLCTQSSSWGMRASFRKPKDRKEIWFEENMLKFQKRKLYLRHAMVKNRTFTFTYPKIPFMTTTNSKPIIFVYQLSNIAGHGAFMCLALSYIESDILQLRVFAVSSGVLSMLFQFYREKPLWIPLQWNMAFLIINGLMIALLIKEAADGYNIPDDQKQLYIAVFENRGMKLTDFLYLISHAKKETKKVRKNACTMIHMCTYTYKVK